MNSSDWKNQRIAKNLPLIYTTSALMWGRFFVPIIALFYIASQVSIEEFTIIMAVFSLVILLLEIPSGAVADLLGYKKTLLLARSLYLVEIYLLAFTNGFWPFLFAKIISGIGVSLSSGTTSGLLFETLKDLGLEKDHKKYSGINMTITQISMGVTFVVGAWLFSVSPKLPAILSLPFIAAGLCVTFFLIEPNRSQPPDTRIGEHLRRSFTLVLAKREATFLTLYAFFTGGVVIMILSISSAYFEAIGIAIPLIGVIALISALASAYAAKKTDYFEKLIGEKWSIISIYVALISLIVFMSWSYPLVGVLSFIALQGVYGFYQVVTDNYMNIHSESRFRVTMLSVRNMSANLSVTALFPIVGHLARSQGYSVSLSFVVVCMVVGAIVLLWFGSAKNLSLSINHHT